MNRIIVFALILILSSCARQGILTGGERDETPPQVILSEPSDQSINFSATEITLEFDELITLNQITQQLLVTPTINEDIEISSNKTTVSLSNLKLKENTTYTFNFREGIVDLNEKNPADLTLAISTGSYIDSLFIIGTIKNLQTNKPEEDIDILLYDAADTLNFFEDKPIYLTKSNENGEYQFTNLKPGNYFIYANQDKNGNGSNQSEEEAFAFLSDTLSLVDSLNLRPLLLQQLDTRPFSIVRSRPFGKYFDLGFKKYINEYALQNLSNDNKIVSKLYDTNRKIRIYDTDGKIGDTLTVALSARDSINQIIQDTVQVYFQESKRKPETFTMSVQPQNRAKILEDFQAKFKFNKPIAHINYDSIKISYDTLQNTDPPLLDTKIEDHETSYTLFYQLNKDSLLTKEELTEETKTNKRSLTINKGQNARSIILNIGQGAFISIEGDSSKPVSATYKIADKESGGSIYGEIQTNYTHFFIELTKEGPKNEPIRIPGTPTYAFKNLGPGKYSIRFLIDQNSNGLWDQGNILKNIEPEPIIYPSDIDPDLGSIPLNSGWTVEQNYRF